jgi:cation:H+ antiporter
MAALRGSSDLALGNVVGSNILNVLFILGLSALIIPLAVSVQLVRFDVPLLVGVSVAGLLMGLDGTIGRGDGILLMAGLVVHVYFCYRIGLRAGSGAPEAGGSLAVSEGLPRAQTPWKGTVLTGLLVVASLGLLVLGSRWLVASASTLARAMGISEMVIGLTVVAAGTSLPEVATSVMAAIRGERDIAVGNVIGSSIFNLLGVLGLSAILAPGGITVAPAILSFDLPIMVGVAVICLPIFFNGMTVFRWEGALLFGYFALYTAFVLLRAAEHDALHGFVALVTYGVLPLTVLTLAAVTLVNLHKRARPEQSPR